MSPIEGQEPSSMGLAILFRPQLTPRYPAKTSDIESAPLKIDIDLQWGSWQAPPHDKHDKHDHVQRIC
jgi:hypothetical protein